MTRKLMLALACAATLWAQADVIKRLPASEPMRRSGIQVSKARPQRAASSATSTLFESFEGPGDKTWLPEGWTRQTSSASTDPEAHWFNYGRMVDVAPPVDGSKFMAVMYDSEYKDEWIISPEVPVVAGQTLSLYWWTQPVYLYIIDRYHMDYENWEFTNQEVAATLQVLVKPQGGEWTTVYDLAENYMGTSYQDLYDMRFGQMQRAEIDMTAFAGEQVSIAIRYVGTDGDSMFVDAVSLDNPPLAAVYSPDWFRQFYAFSYDTEMMYSRSSVEFYPVNEAISWYNDSYGNPSGTTYEWAYVNDEGVEATSTSRDLTVTYTPWYGPDIRVVPTPELTAMADGYANTSYQAPSTGMVFGGTPVIPSDDGPMRVGVWSMDVNRDGLFAYTVDGADFGLPSIPVFGYSADSDQWWSDYVSPSHSRTASLQAYLNVLFVPDSPMVVDGVVAYGLGAVGDDAEFRVEIYALRGDELIPDAVPVASATCRGSEMTHYAWGIRYDQLVIPFAFDTPAVLSSTDAEAYAVFVSGFRGPDVEWFAPLMAEHPNDLDICYSQYVCRINDGANEFDNIYMTAYFQNDYGEDLTSTFAISLGATYPWLEAEATEVALEGEAEVTLGSSYDASSLAVTGKGGAALPQWLTATLSGSGDDITLALAGSPEADTDVDIVVSAPGVSQTITVHAAVASIESITASGAAIEAVYTIAGQRVDAASLAPGVYVVRLSDGTARKVVK